MKSLRHSQEECAAESMKNLHNSHTLVCIDLDGTLVDGQSQQHFLNFLLNKKIIGFWYFVYIYWWFLLYKLHLASDPTQIMNFAYRAIRGKTVAEIDTLLDVFFEEDLKPHIYQRMVDMMRLYKERGAIVLLISNSTEIIVERVAQYIGANAYIATRLRTKDAIYTGEIIPPIVYGQIKLEALEEYINNNNLNDAKVVVYADHLSDLYLFERADEQHVVNPTRKLKRVAQKKSWDIMNQE